MVDTPRMGRLVKPQRRLLRAAHQSARLGCRGAVANLHPTLRGGSSVPHSQERAVDPSHLAPTRRPGAGAHPGVLPRLRPVEDIGAMAEPCRPGQQSTYDLPGAWGHPKHRHRPANCDGAAARAATALRRAPRSRPSGIAPAARVTPARTVAHVHRRTPNVVPTPNPKPLKTLVCTPETAEVGLEHVHAD